VSFGCAIWALDHLLENGESAYLPRLQAEPHLDSGALHPVAGAPSFGRTGFLVTNDSVVGDWPWLAALAERLSE